MDGIKKVVLAVDDMPEILSSINAALSENYDVRCAADAKSAFSALESIKPNVIMLDIEMPEMSGLEILEKLQKDARYKDIPVVFLTANSEESTAQKAIKNGALGYIIKPFTPESLLKSIDFFS
ncbi:MAG: response regulator [Spirochaetaceae bacterium]|jgi:CheY-like chemotaxis protein|nr:response regulator [Spirochaetaceae bacterium]